MASEISTRTPNGFLIFVGSAALLVVVAGVFIITIGSTGADGESLEQKRAAKRTEIRTRLEKEAQEKLNSTGWVDKAKGTVHIPINDAIAQIVAELKAKKPTVSQIKVEAPLPMPVADPNSKDPAPAALPSAPQGADTIRFTYPIQEVAPVATPAPSATKPAETPAPIPTPAKPAETPAPAPAPAPAKPAEAAVPAPAPVPVKPAEAPVPAPAPVPPKPADAPAPPPAPVPAKPADAPAPPPKPAESPAPAPAPVPAKPAEAPVPPPAPTPPKPSDAPAPTPAPPAPAPAAAPASPEAPSRPPIINPTENSEPTK